ncbi:MarR family winged helix-turn-helix transcriptional regulator [Enemella sp. A6]|uniref:MarR family winged helix-turn-helix transcriptional regulator n=1 Tax=Enemella sp. A6 TaxID=3440152 RepID=UPI003EBBBF4B
MSQLREETMDVMSELTVELGQQFSAGSKRVSLTPVRTAVLHELSVRGNQRLTQLCEAMAMSPQQVSVLVDALVERGLVSRTRDPEDGRAVLIDLTDEGRETSAVIARMRVGVAERLLGQFDEDELVTLRDLIHRVLMQARNMREA